MNRLELLGLALIVCGALSGCATDGSRISDIATAMTGKLAKRDDPLPRVHKIVPLWRSARGTNTKGMPARGAAGQILFFQADSKEPIPLTGKGMVVIYVFDEKGPANDPSVPVHKYRFPIAAWNLYLQQNGPLGPSYHVFMPYSGRDIHQVTMSLAVKLVSEDGRVVATSDMVPITLHGPMPEDPMKGRNLASERPNRKTKATTLDQQFFDLERDRDLRKQGLRQGTQVSHQKPSTNRRSPTRNYGNYEVRRSTVPDIANDPEIRRILQQHRDQPKKKTLHFPSRVTSNNTQARRGFRLSGVTRNAPRYKKTIPDGFQPRPKPAREKPAAKRHPMQDLGTQSPGGLQGRGNDAPTTSPKTSWLNESPSQDPFAQNYRRNVSRRSFDRENRGPIVNAGAWHEDPAPRSASHPLVDERAAWQND